MCGSVSIWQIELLPTVEADLVCAVFDREHAAQVPVPAAKEKVNNLEKQSHTSCALRRSPTSTNVQPVDSRFYTGTSQGN
jgi:hypothetical protein